MKGLVGGPLLVGGLGPWATLKSGPEAEHRKCGVLHYGAATNSSHVALYQHRLSVLLLYLTAEMLRSGLGLEYFASFSLSELHQLCLWAWLGVEIKYRFQLSGPSRAALQYVMYFRFCGKRHVSYNWPFGGLTLLKQPLCNAVYGLTPLLHGIVDVLSQTTADASTR